MIIESARRECGRNRDRDIIVATSKLVMKARGYLVRLSDVRPSLVARLLSRLTGKNPVEVELVLRASRDLVAVVDVWPLASVLERLSEDPVKARELVESISSLFFVVTRQGLIAMDGGVDYSNVPPGYAIANIVGFDEEARVLRDELVKRTGRRVAVVITDTETNTSEKRSELLTRP